MTMNGAFTGDNDDVSIQCDGGEIVMGLNGTGASGMHQSVLIANNGVLILDAGPDDTKWTRTGTPIS
jgi:hypothetical protein